MKALYLMAISFILSTNPTAFAGQENDLGEGSSYTTIRTPQYTGKVYKDNYLLFIHEGRLTRGTVVGWTKWTKKKFLVGLSTGAVVEVLPEHAHYPVLTQASEDDEKVYFYKQANGKVDFGHIQNYYTNGLVGLYFPFGDKEVLARPSGLIEAEADEAKKLKVKVSGKEIYGEALGHSSEHYAILYRSNGNMKLNVTVVPKNQIVFEAKCTVDQSICGKSFVEYAVFGKTYNAQVLSVFADDSVELEGEFGSPFYLPRSRLKILK